MPPTRPSTPNDAAISVLDLTRACISKFEALSTPEGPGHNEALENRMADLKLWADGVGAIAEPGGASLDSRLSKRPNDLELVKSILIMLRNFLDEYADLAEKDSPTCEAICNVDSSMKNLAMVGVAIRRTDKVSYRWRASNTFDATQHVEFRRNLECIFLRPSEDGRSEKLDVSQLDEIQNRLIEANLRRRHRFLSAQIRFRNSMHRQTQQQNPAVPSGEDGIFESRPQTYGESKPNHLASTPSLKDEESVPPTMAGFSAASTAEGTLQYAPAKRHTPEPAKTQAAVISSNTEFPEPSQLSSDRPDRKCSCCCQPLLFEELENRGKRRQHLIEDLCPYTCVAENCPTPYLLFVTRKEWESHVKRDHPTQWKCPFCDEQGFFFLSMEAIVDHIHGNHKEELSNHPISTLLSWSAVQCMGIKSCPLCSYSGPQDSPELVDHVLRHSYEFSLRALPWPRPTVHDSNKPIGTYNFPKGNEDADRLEKWIREEESGASGLLGISEVDKSSHYAPASMDLIDYTDYFSENNSFREKSGEGSTKVQNRSSFNVGSLPGSLSTVTSLGNSAFTEQDKHTHNTTKDTQTILGDAALVEKGPLKPIRPNFKTSDQVSIPIEKNGVVKPGVLVVHQVRPVGRSWEYQLKDSKGNLFKDGQWIPQKVVRRVR